LELIALSRAGYDIVRLAGQAHGFSSTTFGLRYLNRIRTLVEDRYAGERVVLTDGGHLAVLQLRQLLSENQIVGIRAHDTARDIHDVPFLDGSLRLAAGPIEIARMTGAALLPMFTVRNESGGFELHVEAPIKIENSGDREELCRQALLEYVHVLENYVARYPGQWVCWYRQASPRANEPDYDGRPAPGATG
jgi:lauroyl/myristoyl acyltransferase